MERFEEIGLFELQYIVLFHIQAGTLQSKPQSSGRILEHCRDNTGSFGQSGFKRLPAFFRLETFWETRLFTAYIYNFDFRISNAIQAVVRPNPSITVFRLENG